MRRKKNEKNLNKRNKRKKRKNNGRKIKVHVEARKRCKKFIMPLWI